ncbi:response regulator [uncultured Kordia sp.]|uniref:LytR/AlgR family response regulator transcription factor n=1 Tax=uncultured Kordia sp. TaxID=507699 RepID=UPI00262B43CE|nr:response regulator [uncultured Kordia sp.]
MKIRYILVDDDLKTIQFVKTKIDRIAADYELEHIASYTSSKKAYEEVKPDSFDVLLVDFQMPVYNGIQLAEKIAASKKIIFLTSTTGKQAEIINNLEITGYLSKPFELEEFEKILQKKVIGKINTSSFLQNDTYLSIPIGTNKDIGISPEQVFYISKARNRNSEQPKKNCVHIYGKNDVIIHKDVRLTIAKFSELLAPYKFEKISQNTIINMSHIKERDNRNIELYHTQETFEVTEKEKSSFIQKLASFFSPKNH